MFKTYKVQLHAVAYNYEFRAIDETLGIKQASKQKKVKKGRSKRKEGQRERREKGKGVRKGKKGGKEDKKRKNFKV